MFDVKQNNLNRANNGCGAFPLQSTRRIARLGLRGLCALTLMLGCANIAHAQAEESNQAGRAGDTPNPTIKKDSVPMGVKPKAPTKKAAPTKAAKTKSAGRGKMMTARRIVLVFPVDAKGAAAEQLSDVVTDVEKSRLSATGQYGGISFLTSLPSIRRAVGEQSLTPSDVQPPFATRAKAQKLTTTAGYDLGVISSLDQYEYNADKQNVSIVLSIQMIDFAQDPPRSYTAADSVTTAPKSAKNATDTAAAEEATRNLTEKLMTNVLNSATGAKSPSPTAAPTGKAPMGKAMTGKPKRGGK